MAINYDEFANALKALTKRPMRGKHALLRRIRTNTLSEIEVICRLMKCQAGLNNFQVKDTMLSLHQGKSLIDAWRASLRRADADSGSLLPVLDWSESFISILRAKVKLYFRHFFARMAASAPGSIQETVTSTDVSFDFLVEAKHLCENCSKDGSEVVLAVVLDVESCNKSGHLYSNTYGYVCPSLQLVKKRVKGLSVSASRTDKASPSSSSKSSDPEEAQDSDESESPFDQPVGKHAWPAIFLFPEGEESKARFEDPGIRAALVSLLLMDRPMQSMSVPFQDPSHFPEPKLPVAYYTVKVDRHVSLVAIEDTSGRTDRKSHCSVSILKFMKGAAKFLRLEPVLSLQMHKST